LLETFRYKLLMLFNIWSVKNFRPQLFLAVKKTRRGTEYM
jgi:hypothetical protein